MVLIFYVLAVRLGDQLHAMRHGKNAIADFFLVNSVPSLLDGFLQPALPVNFISFNSLSNKLHTFSSAFKSGEFAGVGRHLT